MLANSDFFCFSSPPLFRQRAVAQSGSVLAWGARGRGFESRQPDHYFFSLFYKIYSGFSARLQSVKWGKMRGSMKKTLFYKVSWVHVLNFL